MCQYFLHICRKVQELVLKPCFTKGNCLLHQIFVIKTKEGIGMKALIGRKIGMTTVLSEGGVAVPVTLITAGPCVVTRIKTVESDGYNAVQNWL